jgi:hypothetical protein
MAFLFGIGYVNHFFNKLVETILTLNFIDWVKLQNL